MGNITWYKDWRFWLLFFVINVSGNLGFGLLLNDKISIIALFIITTFAIVYNRAYTSKYLIFIIAYTIITLMPGFYSSSTFSFSSSIHILMKVSIGISTILLLKTLFVNYYLKIIVFFAIISLICFFLNFMGIVLPFIEIEATNIDSGYIFRVYSVIYTQLYNPASMDLNLRNCGPFWEPGAYQGYLNLGLAIMSLTSIKRDKKFYYIYLLLLICIITTFSTGGYIVLFLNLILLLVTDVKIKKNTKPLILAGIATLFLVVYFSLDFLSEKISTDNARLGTSFEDLGSGMNFLFGYGYAAESIKDSTIQSVSSLINLFRYSGVLGFILYFGTLIGTKINVRTILWVLIISCILMNEPYLNVGPFWWGIPFVMYYLTKYKQSQRTHRGSHSMILT